MTPDPVSGEAAVPSDPQSWNRYAYTRGDAINRGDASGLGDCPVTFCVTGTGYADPPPAPITLDDSFWETGAVGGAILDSYYTSQIASTWQATLQTVANTNASTIKVDATLAQLRNALSSDSKCLGLLESGIAGNNLSVFNSYFNALDGANSQTPLATALDFSLLPSTYQGLNGLQQTAGS